MDTKEYVEYLLKNYQDLKRSLDNLKIEIECFSGVSYDKVIESLNFTTPEGERVQCNSVSDKSGRIALMYRDVADGQNEDILQGLLERFYAQKKELDILELRINLLEPRIAEVIRDMFIVGITWPVLCKKYNVSYATIGRYRNKGIDEICRLYAECHSSNETNMILN